MAVELVRHLWCDLCQSDGDEKVVADRTLVVSMNGTFAEVDLCVTHGTDWTDKLTDLLILGRTTEGAPPRASSSSSEGARRPGRPLSYEGQYGCPICSMRYSATESVRVHVWRDHIGQPKPTAQNGPCPECGQVFGSVQGLGSHRSAAHGLDSVAQLIRSIEQEGYSIEQLRQEQETQR